MKARQGQRRALAIIQKRFPVMPWSGRRYPFEALVTTILSQNTNDKNRDMAVANLKNKFLMTPVSLAKAEIKEITDCIRPAGLYRVKAPKIKAVARTVLLKYGGSLRPILTLPTPLARERLTELKGVGPKTADVILCFCAGRDVLPVDTHIARVSRRLGITPKRADYHTIRDALEKLIQPSRRRTAHLSIIEFGRRICKALYPLCYECPVFRFCKDPIRYRRLKARK